MNEQKSHKLPVIVAVSVLIGAALGAGANYAYMSAKLDAAQNSLNDKIAQAVAGGKPTSEPATSTGTQPLSVKDIVMPEPANALAPATDEMAGQQVTVKGRLFKVYELENPTTQGMTEYVNVTLEWEGYEEPFSAYVDCHLPSDQKDTAAQLQTGTDITVRGTIQDRTRTELFNTTILEPCALATAP